MARTKLCGHCGKPPVGFAQANNVSLCHPDVGLDCYALVTVYRHSMPCDRVGCVVSEDESQADLVKKVREALSQLDGSVQSTAVLMSGFTAEELDELGGFE